MFTNAVLLLLNYYQIILTCNMVGAAGRAGRAYPSRAPDVTPSFFVGVYIASGVVF